MGWRDDLAGTFAHCASEFSYASERLTKGEDSVEDILADLQDWPENARRAVDELEAHEDDGDEEDEEIVDHYPDGKAREGGSPTW